MWPPELAFFDCDGVLLDSNGVKSDAFRAALADEPPADIDAALAHHRAHGGVSRYVKLERHFGERYPANEVQRRLEVALARFAAAARDGLATCPTVPGTDEVLALFANARTSCHVVSGGDQTEVREALAAHNLASRFAGIWGSPTTKDEHLARLRGAAPHAWFFGDARLDMEVAERHNCTFVFVAGVTDWPQGAEVAAARGHRVIQDFTDLLARPQI